MIYVTGDTHGRPARLSPESMPFAADWTKSDSLVVCGDFGFLFSGSNREELFLRDLSFRPYQTLFLDGNHENFKLLEQFPVVQWHGGKAHRIRRNVYHLMRGQVYELGGKSIFTMGGGYSIDRARRFEGVDWWPQEMPSEEELEEGRANLLAHDMKVDYVLTHAAPEDVMTRIYGEHPHERPLNEFLQWVADNVAFKRWYFGHLHMDVTMPDERTYAMFTAVRRLDTGDMVW